jgi:hypothetical protein
MTSDGKSACQEGFDLVHGERVAQYGDPVVCYRRLGEAWGHLLSIESIPADRVALMMVMLKLYREINTHKRDNLVDACGYLEIADMAGARR